jgi:hypothetical protein
MTGAIPKCTQVFTVTLFVYPPENNPLVWDINSANAVKFNTHVEAKIVPNNLRHFSLRHFPHPGRLTRRVYPKLVMTGGKYVKKTIEHGGNDTNYD